MLQALTFNFEFGSKALLRINLIRLLKLFCWNGSTHTYRGWPISRLLTDCWGHFGSQNKQRIWNRGEDLWHLAALILIWNIHHPFRRQWKTERVRKSTQTHGGKIWPLWQQFRMRWGHISAQTPQKRHKNNQDSSLLSLAILNPRIVYIASGFPVTREKFPKIVSGKSTPWWSGNPVVDLVVLMMSASTLCTSWLGRFPAISHQMVLVGLCVAFDRSHCMALVLICCVIMTCPSLHTHPANKGLAQLMTCDTLTHVCSMHSTLLRCMYEAARVVPQWKQMVRLLQSYEVFQIHKIFNETQVVNTNTPSVHNPLEQKFCQRMMIYSSSLRLCRLAKVAFSQWM